MLSHFITTWETACTPSSTFPGLETTGFLGGRGGVGNKTLRASTTWSKLSLAMSDSDTWRPSLPSLARITGVLFKAY